VKKILSMFAFLIIGAFLTQGFQCSSPEMSTAKIARNNTDWEKVKLYAGKELQKNPKNMEAVMLIIEAHMRLNEMIQAIDFMKKHEKNLNDPDLTNFAGFNLQGIKYQMWVNCYSEGINHWNSYIENKSNKIHLDSAQLFFEKGLSVRPNRPELLRMLAICADEKNDTLKSIEYYGKYVDFLKPEFEIAKQKGIYLNMNQDDLVRILDKPLSSKGEHPCDNCDSTMTNVYKYGMKNVTVFLTKKGNEGFLVRGWRSVDPKDWIEPEKQMSITFETSPYFILAYYYYNHNQPEKAVGYFKDLLILDPTNSDANNSLVQIYQSMNKSEEAEKYIKELMSKDPENVVFMVNYADILHQKGEYDESIKYYEKALAKKPGYEQATRNIAAAYKNKAATIQKKLLEESGNDYSKVDAKKYEPYLQKSVEYFEKARKFDQYRYDVNLYGDLLDLYFALGNTTKMNAVIDDLIIIENSIKEKKSLEQYYLIMFKAYDKLSDADQSKYYQEKYNKLISK